MKPRLYYVRCFVLANSEHEARSFAMNFAEAQNMEADIATVNHVCDDGARDRLPVKHPASENVQTCGELVGLANWMPPEVLP